MLRNLSALVLISTILPASAAFADRSYTVVKGDDCIGIAIKQLGSRAAVNALHKANPGLGATPHKLKPGTVLVLPDMSKADATLSRANGSVRVREPSKGDWDSGQRGMPLFRAWRVNTQTKASAEITFANQSLISMREDTVVVIFGSDATKSRIDAAEVELESGALTGKLGQLAGRPSGATIKTKSAGITGAVSDFLIVVDEVGNSLVANHGKSKIAVRGVDKNNKPTGKAVAVGENMGTKVQPGKAPEAPRALPLTPQWQGSPSQNVLGTPSATLLGRWIAIAGATSYRVEIRDTASEEVTVVEVPGTTSGFELQNTKPGSYIVRVSAKDKDGLESKASQPLRITVDAVAAGWRRNHGLQLALGASIVAPPGKPCSLNDAQAKGSLVVGKVGHHRLTCGTVLYVSIPPSPAVDTARPEREEKSPGTPLSTLEPASLEFDVLPVTASSFQGTNAKPLVAKEAAQVEVLFNGELAGNVNARVVDDHAVILSQSFAAGQLSVTVVANAATSLEFSVAGQVFATLPLAVKDREVPKRPVSAAAATQAEPRAAGNAPTLYELGGGLGWQTMLRNQEELAPESGRSAEPTYQDGINARAFLTRRFGKYVVPELGVGFANVNTEQAGSQTARMFSTTLQFGLGYRVKAFEARALAGGGARFDFGTGDGDAFSLFGAAMLWHLSDAGFRIDARSAIGAGRNDSLSVRGEFSVGVFAHF